MRLIGDYKIYHWSEIQDSFCGADLFLGNGFSININSALNYRSLFDRFLIYLDSEDQVIFKKFNSTNFEGIQGKMADALEVNRAFNQDTHRIESAIKMLKFGLLGAIKDLHPQFLRIDPSIIFQLSQKLDWFGDIFTTNYDVFLYHIVLTTLDRAKRNNSIKKYQDFFRNINGELQFTNEHLTGYKNLYYMHGALFLRKEGQQIIKAKRGRRGEELLELIRLQVHLGYVPVFVSEGKSFLKAETISRNEYLAFCRRAFKASRNSIVIHGFSFSNSDSHLTGDLNENKRKIAVGLHLSGSNDIQTQCQIRRIEEKLHKYRANEIKYFDSKTLF